MMIKRKGCRLAAFSFLLLIHTLHAFFLQTFLLFLESFQLSHQAALRTFVDSLLLNLCLIGFEDSEQLRFIGCLAEDNHNQDTDQT